MVKFRLKGQSHNLWALKVVKKTKEGKDYPDKTHLKGGTEYSSEGLNLPFEEVKRQLGDVIIWSDEKVPEIEQKAV